MPKVTSITVRQGSSLPAPAHSPDHTVRHGYAVRHSGPTHRGTWLFFEHIEPAWAYGRSAGMAVHTSTWTIRRAALSVRVDRATGDATHVIHLSALVPWNTEGTFDARTLARWLEGMTDSSSRWAPLH